MVSFCAIIVLDSKAGLRYIQKEIWTAAMLNKNNKYK